MKQIASTLILLLTFMAAQAQKPAQSTKPSPGTQPPRGDTSRKLSGRVVDETGKPVSDAALLAMPTGKTENMQQVLVNYRTATSDEQGRFTFDELSPGAYRLVAAAPGHVLAQDSAEEGGRPKLFRTGEPVTLRLVRGAVITGTVTDGLGEPLVAARVRAHRIKDEKGRPAVVRVTLDESLLTQEWKTDDRGIYRIYGLEPGTYVVAAGGKGLNPMSMGGFDADAPSYHPSGTRDTAVPVAVQAGQEVTGIDIRWREAKGFIVSGKVVIPEGKEGTASAVVVTLTNAATGNVEGLALTGFMGVSEDGSAFALTSIGEGEYNVTATSVGDSPERTGTDNMLVSPPRRVTIKGADVTGLELKLAPLGSISGQFVIERLKASDVAICQPKRTATIEEVVVAARSDAKRKDKPGVPVISLSPFAYSSDGVPDDKGAFRIVTMEAGRYRFDIKLPSEDWYVAAITQTKDAAVIDAPVPDTNKDAADKSKAKEASAAPEKDAGKVARTGQQPIVATQPRDLAARGLAVKMGERVTGVRVVAAEGAAAIKGQVKPEKAGEQIQGQLRVFLVPAEPEHADNVLRFHQVEVEKDFTFSVSNIAPGRYLVLVRAVTEEEANETDNRPVAWDDDARVTLRLAALAANNAVDLAICQRLAAYTLKFAAVPPAKKPEPKKGQ